MGNAQRKDRVRSGEHHHHHHHHHQQHHHLPRPPPYVLMPFSPALAANNVFPGDGSAFAEEGPFWLSLVKRISESEEADTVNQNKQRDEDDLASVSETCAFAKPVWDSRRLVELLEWTLSRLSGVEPPNANPENETAKGTIDTDNTIPGESSGYAKEDRSSTPANDEQQTSVSTAPTFSTSSLGGSVLGGLVSFLENGLSKDERKHFFGSTLPFIFAQVLLLPRLFGPERMGGTPLQRLLCGETAAVDLSETQLCALVCAQFLCCIPDQHAVALKPQDTERVLSASPDLSEGAAVLLAEECACVVRFPCPNFIGTSGGSLSSYLFCGRAEKQFLPHLAAKLRCLLSYLDRRQQAQEKCTVDRILTFRRQAYAELVPWQESTKRLTPITIISNDDCADSRPAGIEDARDCAQVDFANRFIGGGVLQSGCVQEEIRFAVSPELLPSLIFCSALRHHEALIVSNTAMLCDYKGYATKFEFVGPTEELHPSIMIAIDALDYRSARASLQFEKALIVRDLQKAFVGFSEPAESHVVCGYTQHKKQAEDRHVTKTVVSKEEGKRVKLDKRPRKNDESDSSSSSDGGSDREPSSSYDQCCEFRLETAPLRPVATGNWGAGAFRGSAELKAIVQWLAASQSHRGMHYYPYGRASLGSALEELQRTAIELGADVGNVARALFCVCASTEAASVFSDDAECPLIKAVTKELRTHYKKCFDSASAKTGSFIPQEGVESMIQE